MASGADLEVWGINDLIRRRTSLCSSFVLPSIGPRARGSIIYSVISAVIAALS